MGLPIFLGVGFAMKEFFTYEQQLNKLKEEGLVIDDEVNAAEYLKREGYYNVINGYSEIFKNKFSDGTKKYIKNTKFDDVLELYRFDKNLRSMMYKYILSIETYIKSLVSYEFSKVHGVDENKYLQLECFSEKDSEAVERLLEECRKIITDAINTKSNRYRKYIEHTYIVHKHIPLWVLIRALTFGQTSIFYKNMHEDEKREIASVYNLNTTQLANVLEVVVTFRNIVAHGERTYCARLPKTRLSTSLNIVKKLSLDKNVYGDNKYGRSDFLALLICCKYLLPPFEFTGLIFELDAMFDNLQKNLSPQKVAQIKKMMGLANNSWKNLPKLKIE